MSRLIYADEVKELLLGLDSLPWEDQVDEIVDAIPTAYDVEEKIRTLEAVKAPYEEKAEHYSADGKGVWCNYNIAVCVGVDKAIEVMRGEQ